MRKILPFGLVGLLLVYTGAIIHDFVSAHWAEPVAWVFIIAAYITTGIFVKKVADY